MTVYGYTRGEIDQIFEELAKLNPRRYDAAVFSKGWAWPRTPLRNRKIQREQFVYVCSGPITSSDE